MEIGVEHKRFNDLEQEAASKILEAAEGQQMDLRSCWYCNGAHERLKSREALRCFACGVCYLQGYPAEFVVKRSRGEEITAKDMEDFAEALKSADD